MKQKTLVAFLGNCFEHYDKALFTLLIPFISTQYFPHESSIVTLIMGYAMIPLSMLARPFGALFFGYLGDKYSRAYALRLTMFGMGLSTLAVAFTPTFATCGIFAPIFLIAMRFLVQFFSSGEVIGGALYILEGRPSSQHILFSSFYNASTVGGYIIASAATSLFAYFNLIDSYWRFLFLFGALTGFIGTYFRWSNPINPSISTSWSLSSTFLTLWTHKSAVLYILAASGFSYGTYGIAIGMMSGLIPEVTTLTKEQLTYMSTGLLVADFLLLPIVGVLSQKVSCTRLMSCATICATIAALPCFALLENAHLLSVIALRTLVMLIGVLFSAPFHAWTLTLVPEKDRYTVISTAYAIGTQLIGSTSAAFSLWIFHQTEWIAAAGIYWMLLAALCSFLLMRKSRSMVPAFRSL